MNINPDSYEEATTRLAAAEAILLLLSLSSGSHSTSDAITSQAMAGIAMLVSDAKELLECGVKHPVLRHIA